MRKAPATAQSDASIRKRKREPSLGRFSSPNRKMIWVSKAGTTPDCEKNEVLTKIDSNDRCANDAAELVTASTSHNDVDAARLKFRQVSSSNGNDCEKGKAHS